MSLDVSLIGQPVKEICYHCGQEYEVEETLYDANITHNLGKMASEANIYYCIWRPEEIGCAFANEIIEPLSKGLADMKARPDHYKQFNASNGWGTYEAFVNWVEDYLNACIEFPYSKISVSR